MALRGTSKRSFAKGFANEVSSGQQQHGVRTPLGEAGPTPPKDEGARLRPLLFFLVFLFVFPKLRTRQQRGHVRLEGR